MKRIVLVLFLLVVGVACVGISPDAIEPSAKNIVQRHNAYVLADPALSQPEKDAYTNEGVLFLKVIEEAKK